MLKVTTLHSNSSVGFALSKRPHFQRAYLVTLYSALTKSVYDEKGFFAGKVEILPLVIFETGIEVEIFI